MDFMKKLIVAIDGPAAAGKSSVAKLLAKKLGFLYVDTGAMYRCLTLAVLENNVDVNDEKAIAELLKKTKIRVSEDFFYVDGEDVSKKIRSNDVSKNVSIVCAYPSVRQAMVQKQREIGKGSKIGVILDGRDIGTYVFPDADIKIYQTADTETRALRRYQENQIKGIECTVEEVMNDIIRRDRLDSTRLLAPLIKSNEAILIDTSSLSISQNVDKIYHIILNKINEEFDDD
ncbi:MAG: (d)CMP kinase [Bacilli bacterium]|nr:(d)CMP kinase [Bacilli bacterium]